MFKKFLHNVMAILMFVLLLVSIGCFALATCWSHESFNYPLFIGILTYIGHILSTWGWMRI